MALNTYFLGRGSAFYINTGSAYQQVLQTLNITLPTVSREKIDATTLESSATEYAFGISEAAEASFNVLFDPKRCPLHAFMIGECSAATASSYQFKFVLPNAGTTSASFYEWSGSFMSFEPGQVEPKKTQQVSFKIQPSGLVNFTA